MPRISKDEYFMRITEVVALRGSCLKKQVGCTAVDINSHILATGYNGQPRGSQHCDESTPCLAHSNPQASCEAIHAEINMLMQCTNPGLIEKIYITCFPCHKCLMAIRNTGCKEIIYQDSLDVMTSWNFTVPKIRQFGAKNEPRPV